MQKKVKIIGSISPYSTFREVNFSPDPRYFTFQLQGPGDVVSDYVAKIDGSLTRKINLLQTYQEYSRIIGWLDNSWLLVEIKKMPNTPNAQVTTSFWKVNVNNDADRSQIDI